MLEHRDIGELERMHKQAGGHFFDADSKRFFDSRIGQNVWPGVTGWFFTTSEQFHNWATQYHAPRLYTVRKLNADNHRSIDSVGEFQQYTSSAAARRAAEKAAQEEN